MSKELKPTVEELADRNWFDMDETDRFDSFLAQRVLIRRLQAAIAHAVPQGSVVVPVEPTDGLLVSMAMRYKHDFGMEPQILGYNQVSGFTHEQRKSMMNDMRKLHEEVVGEGFYCPEREETYVAYIGDQAAPKVPA